MTEEDQRWLPRAPLNMEYDSNRTKESTAIALTWSNNIKHNPYISISISIDIDIDIYIDIDTST